MARAIKLIDAPIGLFEVDGILVLKTEYSTRHEDGTITPDCYIIESGEYFWGGVDSVEARNNLEVTPVEMPTLTPPNEALPVLVDDEPDREYIDYICPRCKNTISQRRRVQRMETVYQCKYHDNCGQRVDWSNPQPDRRQPEGEANA